jgi:hypothetical protein
VLFRETLAWRPAAHQVNLSQAQLLLKRLAINVASVRLLDVVSDVLTVGLDCPRVDVECVFDPETYLLKAQRHTAGPRKALNACEPVRHFSSVP